MQVSYSEGVANHTGPESCVGIREDAGEALTGERIGQPSSREKLKVPGVGSHLGLRISDFQSKKP